uniref:Uncharacterized protein n=1 Tax=Siphoviridae sp. ctkTz2 TaxID=2827923 RepID=A0A8S5S6X9_9CAUD|nr:MAG TPA: hypothetical protein [Siphoviridae sp. ctkTz2]
MTVFFIQVFYVLQYDIIYLYTSFLCNKKAPSF